MRRRALPAIVVVLVLAACTTERSNVDPDAKVTVRGTIEDADGTPLGARAVRLGSGVSDLEGTAGIATLGLFCLSGGCTGDTFDTDTNGDGQYSFELTGADTQSTFGEAQSFLLSASGKASGDQASGPVVSARFRIQTENLTLPILRLVDPLLRLSSDGGVVAARWEPTAPGPYALGFRGPGPVALWEVSAADPTAMVDGRVLEDVTGLATVAGEQTDQATGSDISIRWRSPGIAFRGGFGAPPSRAAACEARSADGLVQQLDGCRLTDGAFGSAGVPGEVCPDSESEGTATTEPACSPIERVRVRLAEPVAAELLVVRGCAHPCRVATVAAAGAAVADAGSVTGPFATLALGGRQVTAVDVVTSDPSDLVEVSVWDAVDGPALRPVEDPEAATAGVDGFGDDDEEDRGIPAAIATVALAGALVLLYRARGQVPAA